MSAQPTAQAKMVNGKKVKIYSLVMITDAAKQRILLGLKKRGFGNGKYNGFGGKLQENETIDECAVREVREECSLVVDLKHLEKIGVLVYEFIDSDFLMEVHFFHTSRYTGEISESDEMRPEWFDIQEVPFDQMWCDDKDWFPYFLKSDHFHGYFKFSDDSTIIYKHIASVDRAEEISVLYQEVNSEAKEICNDVKDTGEANKVN